MHQKVNYSNVVRTSLYNLGAKNIYLAQDKIKTIATNIPTGDSYEIHQYLVKHITETKEWLKQHQPTK